ncbi:uncharacterized protein [Zea mays]|jgi:hypothetical protein|uniref:uncharacterized protein n=1 Tax=Zea mays TaxID=4577 RepID=UPI000220E282|nr:uncharacterized protein LOC103639354 [Zea mays]|eukprot:XP_008660338.1 uncharacterized protein LOC103639354 [Zea mays]
MPLFFQARRRQRRSRAHLLELYSTSYVCAVVVRLLHHRQLKDSCTERRTNKRLTMCMMLTTAPGRMMARQAATRSSGSSMSVGCRREREHGEEYSLCQMLILASYRRSSPPSCDSFAFHGIAWLLSLRSHHRPTRWRAASCWPHPRAGGASHRPSPPSHDDFTFPGVHIASLHEILSPLFTTAATGSRGATE